MLHQLIHWTSARRLFLISPREDGLWLARESEGRAEGVFRRREDAIRYAVLEGGKENAILLMPKGEEPERGRGKRPAFA
jgi:hypothetical protein